MGRVHIRKDNEPVKEDWFLRTLEVLAKRGLCKDCEKIARDYDHEELERITKELKEEFSI